MRKKIVLLALLLPVLIVAFTTSCNKPSTTAPYLTIDTNYAHGVDTLDSGTVFTIRFRAEKAGYEDLLNSCKVLKSVNGGPDSVLHEMSFYTQLLIQFYSFRAGDSGNVEKYTVTVGDTKGLFASDSVIIYDN